MRWRILIEGKQRGLDHVTNLFTGDPRVFRDGDAYYLEASRVDAYENPPDAHAEALEVISEINGVYSAVSYAPDPIGFGGSLYVVSPDGSLGAQHAHTSVRFLISKEEGLAAGIPLPPSLTSEDASAWIERAKTNVRAAKALRLFGHEPLTWDDLYKVWECVESDVGALAVAWVPGGRQEVSRFSHSAIHHEAAGDAARHAFATTNAPSEPMCYREGADLIRNLLHRWFMHLRGQRTRRGS